jgi:hypothetical protein
VTNQAAVCRLLRDCQAPRIAVIAGRSTRKVSNTASIAVVTIAARDAEVPDNPARSRRQIIANPMAWCRR